MIKAIIFDNGGVLVNDRWPTYVRETSTRLGISEEDFRAKVRHLVRPALIGDLGRGDFLVKLVETVGSSEGVEEMASVPGLRVGVENWLQSLKNRGYRLAILSNDFGDFSENNKIHWRYERFCDDDIYHSSKMGVSKPRPEAFHHVLAKLGYQSSEVVFIDDKEKNIEAASALGMNVIQSISLDQTKKDLDKFLEKENGKE